MADQFHDTKRLATDTGEIDEGIQNEPVVTEARWPTSARARYAHDYKPIANRLIALHPGIVVCHSVWSTCGDT